MNYEERYALACEAQTCKIKHYCNRYQSIMSKDMSGSETCGVCEAYEARRDKTLQGIQPPFLIVAWGVSRYCYSPAEGGCWADWTTILEVRKAHTWERGLRHMRELREEYPQPRFNRFSAANRGEDDIFIRCFYSEADPRMPENTTHRETYQ